MKSIPVSQMMEKLRVYIDRLARSYKVEKSYKLTKVSNNKIRLATDGFIYQQLFDPTSSELPYLVQQANEEFASYGKPMKVPSAWRYYNEISELCKKYGWFYEPNGQGIIDITKEA